MLPAARALTAFAALMLSALACGSKEGGDASGADHDAARAGMNDSRSSRGDSYQAFSVSIKLGAGGSLTGDYTFCLMGSPAEVRYVKARVTNQSAVWLDAMLVSPELRVTRGIPGGGVAAQRMVSTLFFAAKRGDRLDMKPLRLDPGTTKDFVFWYAPGNDLQPRAAKAIGSPDPPDAQIYEKDGLAEWLILPNGEGEGADPRFPIPEGFEAAPTPRRLIDFKSAPASECDVSGNDPFSAPAPMGSTRKPRD